VIDPALILALLAEKQAEVMQLRAALQQAQAELAKKEQK